MAENENVRTVTVPGSPLPKHTLGRHLYVRYVSVKTGFVSANSTLLHVGLLWELHQAKGKEDVFSGYMVWKFRVGRS